jgi:hypothetical protein
MVTLPVRHISIRVPWNDTAWDGRVCRNPRANTSCLALARIAENRDDDYEAENLGIPWKDLKTHPPCLPAAALFRT